VLSTVVSFISRGRICNRTDRVEFIWRNKDT